MRRARARRGGFTLLELLVGLAVFSMLAATAYAGLRTSASSWERSEARIGALETRRTVAAFIRRQLSQAAPLARVERGRWTLWFDGTRDRVVFLADLPTYIGEGGMHEVAIDLDSSGGGKALRLRRQRLDLEGEPGRFEAEDKIDRVLLDSVDSFEVEYFGSADGRSEARWHDAWSGQRTMPKLLRVTVVDGEGVTWLPIVARVKGDAIRFLRSATHNGAGFTDSGSVTEDEQPDSDTDVPDPASADGTGRKMASPPNTGDADAN